MADIPAGKRLWKCPDCGSDVLLSITQLDPLACDACLAKIKGSKSKPSESPGIPSVAGLVPLLLVGGVMLAIGLIAGFVAGRMSVPPPQFVRPTRPSDDADRPTVTSSESSEADPPDESTRPGPGYKWIHGYTRKDGVKVKGHWHKDPNFTDPEKKHRK